jgi:hypothetical protein
VLLNIFNHKDGPGVYMIASENTPKTIQIMIRNKFKVICEILMLSIEAVRNPPCILLGIDHQKL